MPHLNQPLPDFSLDGIVGDKTARYSLDKFKGRWLVLFFYPADFSFVCPTEVVGFQERLEEFEAAGCDVAGISVDDAESHRQWARELGGLSYPLLSDPGGETARAYGVLDPEEKRAWRATFIVSPRSTLAYYVVSPMNVGRSVSETLRVVKALQTGRLCPADWKPQDAPLQGQGRF